ncbi:MAG: hypothetical protein ACK5AZ_10565 [Bryobacteraceae bacterium]
MQLSVFHDHSDSEAHFETFRKNSVIQKLRTVDEQARTKGLDSLEPAKSPLISLGMEIDDTGLVTKNGYGVFHLSWLAQQHPEWPDTIATELQEIRARLRETHRKPLRFLIWAGMGGSSEDKAMYNAAGLLRRGPRVYVLDSTDPSKLKHILDDMTRRAKAPLPEVLRSTLVVGMAMGMTSYEPVVNLQVLAKLYEKHRIDSRPNFVYMTLPGSLLDQFGASRGYRKVELQPDNGNSTAGRHSGPLTRGSLYPLGLAGHDLRTWIEATFLTDEEIETALRLASFLHAHGAAGRDKVTLLLPKEWAGAGLWTKQDFEESLGKSEALGIKIVIDEAVRLANYRPPKDPLQDRVFLSVQIKGKPDGAAQKATLLRRAGYPVAALTLPRNSLLSRYMQFTHYVVFGLGYLRDMNFVTQPSVELYKAITNRLHAEAGEAGGIEKTREWLEMKGTACQAKWRGGITLRFNRLPSDLIANEKNAAALYAGLLQNLADNRRIGYGELTFFGDMRYSPQGRAVRKRLDRAAEEVFRKRLKMPVDVYEGPAMNHSFHEMVIGHGKCLSTVLISDKAEKLPEAGYTADYHRAQFLATQMALAERGRLVVSISLKDLEDETLDALSEFFRQVASLLKAAKA